jgi:3'-phosphoadenosine 5'-phosphosulfate sulfotransferase (PAPS reductase)/FAD synthetase
LNKLRVLSLGAGVQSSTLALMIEKGEIPMVDCAIFSDVGAEPQKVYDWLEYLKTQLSYPVHTVQWRNLKDDIISASKGEYKGFTAPYFSKNLETGKKGMLRRQCTADYKIKPVTQKIRELLGYKKGERVAKDTKVEMVMGISFDEMQRMKTNQIKYIENQYPLVEMKIRRHHCVEWMEKHNYPKPPRSACTFCPFHKNSEWQEIKQNKQEWEEVVMIDKLIRHQEKHKKNIKNEHQMDELFLHAERKPIDEIDFRSAEEKGQYSLLDECEGMCGI